MVSGRRIDMLVCMFNLNSSRFMIDAVEGPRIVRLAGVVDRGFKKSSSLDVNVFGSVSKSSL
jgi:hypothetical protein